MACLQERRDNISKWDPSARRVNVSLVAVQREKVVRVDYYHWIREAGKFGWALRVNLDGNQCIKYSVSNSLGERPIDLETQLLSAQGASAVMVYPDCGAEMSKSFKFKMPDTPFNLKRMWNYALGGATSISCRFCGKSCFFTCPLCETSMHRVCGDLVSVGLRTGKFGDMPVPSDDSPIPGWWNSKLCPLCVRAHLSG